jgi:RNA polymerase sigma-70 factor (ECF subfamily)
MSDEWDKSRARKRGGGQKDLALDAEDEEGGTLQAPDSGRTPDEEYDRQFALRFLELVQEALAEDYRLSGKSKLYQHLKPFLVERKGELSHDELSAQLDMTPGSVTKAISRLRERYRDIFNSQLQVMVGEGGDLEEERRFMLLALSPVRRP